MIANNIFSLINEFIKNLYSSGINFYQIIIALIIFNFIIYLITGLIRTIEK